MKALFVLPISSVWAVRWLKGELDDFDVILNAPLVWEIGFMGELPNRAAWRAFLDFAKQVYWHGGFGLVGRTVNPMLFTHYERAGALVCHVEASGYRRYLWPRQAIGQYFGLQNPA